MIGMLILYMLLIIIIDQRLINSEKYFKIKTVRQQNQIEDDKIDAVLQVLNTNHKF